MDMIDGAGGGHMVDSRIKPQLAEKDKPLLLDVFLQRSRIRIEVGGIHGMNSLEKAFPGDGGHELRRKKIDHQFRRNLSKNLSSPSRRIIFYGVSPGVSLDNVLQPFPGEIRHKNLVPLPQEVLHTGPGHSASSENENLLGHNEPCAPFSSRDL